MATAGDSVAEFARWLEAPDGATWNESAILGAIRQYNREDCESTAELATWLRARQAEVGIVWQAPVEKEKKKAAKKIEGPTIKERAAALAESMRGEIPADATIRGVATHDVATLDPGAAPRWRLHSLLADLLEFHQREAKPRHWARYDRAAMSDDERYDDFECLQGLARSERAPFIVDQSFGYEYRFDPEQDTKIQVGDSCVFANDVDGSAVTIASLDTETGLVVLKLGKARAAPHQRVALIWDRSISAAPIPESILASVGAWQENQRLPASIEDFLYRRPPNIQGLERGASLRTPAGMEQTEWAVSLATRLRHSCLSIQGPPGAGKTHTAAHMIVRLLRNGHKVGVTSNGHHAIGKLMIEVLRVAAEESFRVSAFKIGDEEKSAEVVAAGATLALSIKKFAAPPDAFMVGGTAWAFSARESVAMLDYLFVDEAGQVSLANLLGMAPSTRNLILLGDQMQLGQPIQGSHPGESGKSVLQYLMQGQQTVPDDLGLFLATTHRLHPAICAFVSSAYYDGKLRSEPGTEERVLQASAGSASLEAGVLFLPVEHDGNRQASEEEVEVIRQLVDSLIGRQLVRSSSDRKTGGTSRPLALSDILFVAPFNMQVRRLRGVFGAGARVGSVDKFQGQEAPVVIVSMCTSGNEPTPRGVEFLFSPNRLNVAVSRAQTLAIVVGDPRLALTPVNNVEQIPLVNGFCRLLRT